jgi:hypothetical protein
MGMAEVLIKSKGIVEITFIGSFPDPVIRRKAGIKKLQCLVVIHLTGISDYHFCVTN